MLNLESSLSKKTLLLCECLINITMAIIILINVQASQEQRMALIAEALDST